MKTDAILACIEAEEAILGSVLLDPNSMPRISNLLKPEVFYVLSHQRIYKAMEEVFAKGIETDMMQVTNWLLDRSLLETIGGQVKLSQLLNRTVSAANIDQYCYLILEKYARRQLGAAGNSINRLAYNTELALSEITERSMNLIHELSSDRQVRTTLEHISGSTRKIFHEIEEGIQPGYQTGLVDLDELTGGLTKSQMTVIAARAAMGKTWMGCYLVEHIAKTTGKTALFFSAEMSRKEITKRFISMHSGIDSKHLTSNLVPPSQLTDYINAIDTVSALPIMLDDTSASALNPAKMRSTIRQVLNQCGEISIIVLDYLQALGCQTGNNRAYEVGAYAVACKSLAIEFDIPFVVLAQVNRGVESQNDKRPGMADIRDSGMIEQSADTIWTLYRDEYYNPSSPSQGILEVNVAKNRNGSTGIAKVLFEPSTGKFKNLHNATTPAPLFQPFTIPTPPTPTHHQQTIDGI